MAGDNTTASFLHAVRAQLAAVPARTRAPLPARPGFWYWVRATLAFRPIHDPAHPQPTPDPRQTTAPTRSTGTARGITAVIERIIESPAPQRLHHRKTINQFASIIETRHQNDYGLDSFFAIALYLASAHDNALHLATALDRTHARARILERTFAPDDARSLAAALDRARTGAKDLEHNLDRVYALGYIRDVDFARARNLAHDLARDRAFARDLAHSLARDLSRARDVSRALIPDLDFTRNIGRRHDLARNLARDLALARDDAVDRALTLDPTYSGRYAVIRDLDLGHALTLQTVDPSITAARLKQAASNFQGADLRHARLEEADLAWITWDESTQWPPDWRQRIKNASVEQPEESGQYVVLPAFDNDPASITSDA